MGNTTNIAIPAGGLLAIELLEDAGFEAWCVGGFVRDSIRRAPVHDLDIASSAPWQDAARVFRRAGLAVHETGTAFGTVTVIAGGSPIEVTTFRADGGYRDSRHPETVAFVGSIDEDLARRDFTINAMAWHPTRGLRDPFGGLRDLEAGLIRAVGVPAQRFAEDALRILRGIRFASELGFSIEGETLAAMQAHACSLGAISVERVFSELDRMLCGDAAGSALLACPEAVAAVIPEVGAMAGCPQNTPYHIYDVLGHTARVVDGSPATSLSRWSALLHDVGKPACRTTDAAGRDHFKGHAHVGARIAHDVLARLKAPTKLREEAHLLVSYHEWFMPPTETAVLRALRKLDGRLDLFRALLALQVADSLAKAPGITERLEAARTTQGILEEVIARGAPFTLAQLAVNGGDLIAAGWQPGPELGQTLAQLLDAVIDGELENSRETLLAYALTHRLT